MSSLARYLAPTRTARPNPGHVVEWRHGEGGPWLPMADAESLEDAASELASPAVSLTQGDLARVRDPRGVVVGFSVMTNEGLVALPPGSARSLRKTMLNQEMADWHRACGHDWERVWEGSVRADWLLCLAGWLGVDRGLLVLAACDCAETSLQYDLPGETSPRLTLETTRRWALGEATREEVLVALEDTGDSAVVDAARVAIRGDARTAAIYAAWSAIDAATDAARAAADAAAEAATRAAVADAAWADALASMALLVRQRIPLWRLALALAARTQASP